MTWWAKFANWASNWDNKSKSYMGNGLVYTYIYSLIIISPITVQIECLIIV